MNQSFSIVPSPELVHQWADMLASRSDQAVFTMAAQWGADQELDACCEWLARNYNYPQVNHPLRTARRPKLPPETAEFDHCAKPGDFIEVSLWHNAEGFNVDLSSNGDQSFRLTWGQFKALKKLIKELDND